MKTLRVLRNPRDDEKLADQETVILSCIGRKRTPRSEVLARMAEEQKAGNLVTKQDLSHLLSYYTRILKQRGIIEVHVEKEAA